MTESDRLEATYYAILGAQPGASRDELRRAYIAKVKTAHPDLFRFNTALRAKAEERMKQINEAYAYLKRLGDQPAYEQTEAEDDETTGEDPPEDEQDDEEDDSTDFEYEDEDEFTSDDWDDFNRWAQYRVHHASEEGQTTESPTPESEPGYKPPDVTTEPRWAAMVAGISGCYGAIRIAAALSFWSFPVVLAAAWTFTLIQGLRNKLVVFVNFQDVTLSLLAGILILAGQLTGNIYTTLVGLLLCLISAVWSIQRNQSILTGMAVCLFKITFSPCWVVLMAAPWFLSDDRQSASKFRLVAFRGFMMRMMFKLVNGDRR